MTCLKYIIGLFGLSIALSCFSARCEDSQVPDVTVKTVLTGDGIGANSANGASSSALMAETIRLKGQNLRIDYDGGPKLRGSIYRIDGHTWLLSSGGTRALPVAHLPLASATRLDPDKPCWELGFSCLQVEDRLVAGRRATGWRYDHAGVAGPDGTDNGTFWIDRETGVVVSIKGKNASGRSLNMDAVSIDYTPLPDSVMALPAQ